MITPPRKTTRRKRRPVADASDSGPLLEVLDSANRPLLLMPRIEILRQGLWHKAVFLALRNMEGKIFLRKQGSAGQEARWGLSAQGQVLPEESFTEAALRNMEATLPFGPENRARLKFEKELPLRVELGQAKLLACFILSAPAGFNMEGLSSAAGFFADQEELEGLCRDMPEELDAGLLLAVRQNLLFPAR